MAYDLTQKQDVVKFMREATSENDWNRRCDEVKAANQGYPGFWFEAVILSGVAAAAQASWQK